MRNRATLIHKKINTTYGDFANHLIIQLLNIGKYSSFYI
nr:MAG TPA: hypothetical protein [Caudoviricetes sp.]